jgi:hypothetical protein
MASGLEDVSGKCQMWDILFYSYHLDGTWKLRDSLA